MEGEDDRLVPSEEFWQMLVHYGDGGQFQASVCRHSRCARSSEWIRTTDLLLRRHYPRKYRDSSNDTRHCQPLLQVASFQTLARTSRSGVFVALATANNPSMQGVGTKMGTVQSRDSRWSGPSEY